MAGTTTLETIRQKVIKKLYAGHYPIVSNCTSDSDSRTIIKDTELAPAAHDEDFFRCFVFISSQPTKADSGADINEGGTFSATDTTLTVDDGTKFTVADGIQIDSEIMRVTAVAGNDLTVVRATQGTTAATHADGTDIYIIGPAVGETARITNMNFSGSSSQITVAPGFSASPVSGQEYEIHYHFYPNQVRDKINEILENIRHPIILPLSLCPDGDMEDTGTVATYWTVANATAEKQTTGTYVTFGRQSLKLTASAANGYAKSNSVNVLPDTELLVAALCYITPGDSAKITLYDVTNSDEIETAESDMTGWVLFMFVDQAPSTCEQVSIWLESQTNGDITYWDFVSLLPTQRVMYDYPSTLEWSEDFDHVFYYPLGPALSGDNDDLAYRFFTEGAKKWSDVTMQRDETAVTQYRLEIGKKPINRPLFVQGMVDYATLTDDTDTTKAPEDIIVDLTYADMMDAWAQEDLNQDKLESAQERSAKAAAVRVQLAPRMRHFHEASGRVKGAL